jgi:hypothetical protein
VCLDGVFGDEKLRGDLAIAHAAGDQGEDFELACRDAEGLLADCIGSEGGGGFGGDEHFFHYDRFAHHDRFADGFATARDAEAEPDAEGREKDGDERAVQLDGVLDDDEAVFGILEGGDEEAADETEDEDVALHVGVVKKYNGDGEQVVSPARKQKAEAGRPGPFKENDSIHDTCANRVLGSVKMGFWASGR